MEIKLPLFLTVRKKEIISFSRQLSVMVSAGVPVVEALKGTVRQTTNKPLREILSDIASQVEGGTRLSSALGRHPKIFGPFFVNMVKSGETTGRLDEVLNYLADQQEKEYDLLSRIRGALIYPGFIFISLISVGVIAMVFVLPQLISVLKESGAKLPWSTRALIAVSGILTHYWWLILIITVALVVGILYEKQTPEGKIIWDKFKIRIPVVGGIFRRLYLVRFTQSMYTLLRGGVPLADALTATSDVIANAAFGDVLLKTVKEVRDGRPLTILFEKSTLFPKTATQIMAVGEQTGKLQEVLLKLTNFYTLELEANVRTLISLIEPMILIIMGVGVGVMVSAVILPMYQLASSF